MASAGVITNDSVINFAQTGQYKGPQAIPEYTNFATAVSPYVSFSDQRVAVAFKSADNATRTWFVEALPHHSAARVPAHRSVLCCGPMRAMKEHLTGAWAWPLHAPPWVHSAFTILSDNTYGLDREFRRSGDIETVRTPGCTPRWPVVPGVRAALHRTHVVAPAPE